MKLLSVQLYVYGPFSGGNIVSELTPVLMPVLILQLEKVKTLDLDPLKCTSHHCGYSFLLTHCMPFHGLYLV